eukprot:1609888-Ditylum_brightwellii.AAC.1
MSPDGDSTVQVEKLEEITKRWANRVRSEKGCRRIEALKASALPSNFPCDVLYGPPKYLGQGASRIHTVQGIKHICAIIDHGNLDDITGKELQTNIELHKTELGTGTSLIATDYNIFHHCATFTRLKWTWEFMWKH